MNIYINKVFLYKIFQFLLIFLSLLVVAILVNDIRYFRPDTLGLNNCNNYVLSDSMFRLISCNPYSDIGSYLRGALTIIDEGLSGFISKGFSTWPPGYSLLQSILINFNLPIFLSLFIINLSIWSFLIYLIFINYLKDHNIFLKIFLFLLILSAPFFNKFILWNGLLLSDSISTGIFFLSVFYFINFFVNKKNNIYLPVILLAISIHLRAQFELIFLSVTVAFILYTFLNKSFKNYRKKLLIILIFSSILLFPYKFFNVNNGGGFSLVNVNYVLYSIWQTDKEIFDTGHTFFYDGGGNSFCNINYDSCNLLKNLDRDNLNSNEIQSIYLNETIKTLFFSFHKLIIYKAPIFWEKWKINNYENPAILSFTQIFNYLLTFFFFLTLIFKIFKDKLSVKNQSEVIFITFFFIGATFFSWLVHFESRYLISIKMLMLFYLAMFTFNSEK